MRSRYGWGKAVLRDLTGLVTSGSRGWAQYYSDQGSAFIRIQNVKRGSVELDLTDVQCVSPPSGTEGERTKLQHNDVLVSITADLGRIGLFEENIPAYINQHVALVRLREPNLAPFIARYLTSAAGQADLGLMDRGITRAGLGLDDIRAVPVPLPPLAEQRRIVAKLDALLARLARARAELDRVPQLAENLRRQCVSSAFKGALTKEWRTLNSDHVPVIDDELNCAYTAATGSARKRAAVEIDWRPVIELPQSWRWVSIDQLVARVQYGSSAKISPDDRGVPVLRMGNIQRGKVDWSDLKYLPNHHKEFPALLLQEGDVVFNRTNSFELVGKAAAIRKLDKPTSFASYLIRIRPIGMPAELLAYYLNSSLVRRWIDQVASQQVGQANVNGSKLKALGVPLPPVKEQAEMLVRISNAFARADRLEAEAARAHALLDRLEAAILTKAFKGELVPQDLNDESASVLLERIRAQKAAETLAGKPQRGKKLKSAAR